MPFLLKYAVYDFPLSNLTVFKAVKNDFDTSYSFSPSDTVKRYFESAPFESICLISKSFFESDDIISLA